jgi:plasmid maintenance system antidote protein VapI
MSESIALSISLTPSLPGNKLAEKLTTPPAPKPKSQGFFGSLKAKACASLTRHKEHAAAKKLLASSGIQFITPTLAVYVANSKTLLKLHQYLNQVHSSSHLLLDIEAISSLQEADNSPNTNDSTLSNLFASSRIEFPSYSNLSLDEILRMGLSVLHWYRADTKNIAILAVTEHEHAIILSAAISYMTQFITTQNISLIPAIELYNTTVKALNNRILASWKRISPSHRHLLSDLTTISSSLMQSIQSNSFNANDILPPNPTLYFDKLILHRLPQFEAEGTRLCIMLIQRNNFLYTSMQASSIVWIPTNDSNPLTVEIPLATQLTGQAKLRIFHLSECTHIDNPRRLIAEVNIHTATAQPLENPIESNHLQSRLLTIPINELELADEFDDVAYHKNFSLECRFLAVKSDTDNQTLRLNSSNPRVIRYHLEDKAGLPVSSPAAGEITLNSFLYDEENIDLNQHSKEREQKAEDKTQEEEDADVARKLQEEFDREARQERRATRRNRRNSNSVQQSTTRNHANHPATVETVIHSQASISPDSAISNSATLELSDEVFARSLQAEFDQEIAPTNINSRPSRANSHHNNINASENAIVHRYPASAANFEELLALGDFLQLTSGGSSRIMRQWQTHRSLHNSLIEALPQFKLEANSKYLRDHEECQICQEAFALNDEIRLLPCLHSFHTGCIDKWLLQKPLCACCRAPINQ